MTRDHKPIPPVPFSVASPPVSGVSVRSRLPQASRRAVFEVLGLALDQVGQFAKTSDYGCLIPFTQEWLKRKRVSDYTNALKLVHFWGLLTDSGQLEHDFLDAAKQASLSGGWDGLRALLRTRFINAYRSWLTQAGENAAGDLLAGLGTAGFDARSLDALPGFLPETDDAWQRRRKCVLAVSEAIRFLDNRAYLSSQTRPGRGAERSGAESEPPANRAEPAAAARSAAADELSRLTEKLDSLAVQSMTFYICDENRTPRPVNVSFDVPESAYWLEAIALRLLEAAHHRRGGTP